MTAITVPVKVRVVLVKLYMGPAERTVASLRRPLDNTLPGTVMRKIYESNVNGIREDTVFEIIALDEPYE